MTAFKRQTEIDGLRAINFEQAKKIKALEARIKQLEAELTAKVEDEREGGLISAFVSDQDTLRRQKARIKALRQHLNLMTSWAEYYYKLVGFHVSDQDTDEDKLFKKQAGEARQILKDGK